ncbi:YaaC family protein [Burkholderia gladioli]|uniref:YaaC family protein n=1 Tax=Burkholderia gladioli TaxID=28095 RepID=UPI0016421BDF
MPTLRINGRDVGPHKATSSPNLGARTVLTNSHWEYVALWLRRQRKAAALFYWQQAQTFARAAEGMPVDSAPLLLYYSFMNATKALLSAKAVPFDEHHGVRAHNTRGPSSKIALSNEGVKVMQRGIAPALSQYLSEAETSTQHSLEDLLFNIPCIHRTFCLTYKNQNDLFIPLTECRIEFDPTSSTAHFSAKLSRDFSGPTFIRRLPPSLIADATVNDGRTIRSTANIPAAGQIVNTTAGIAAVATFLKTLRPDLNYIAGSQTLWYAKAVVTGPARLKRSPLTCTLLAMHRLSEICRYRPMELASFLNGQKNWLLTEFIRMSPPQFLDELSAELTGQQFMLPNVRPAS